MLANIADLPVFLRLFLWAVLSLILIVPTLWILVKVRLKVHTAIMDADRIAKEEWIASESAREEALREEQRLVVSNWVGKFYTDRITLTPPVFNNAARIMFLVHGAEKAPALKAVLEGPYEPEQLPAQIIRPATGKVVWLVDPTAASRLAPQAKGAV